MIFQKAYEARLPLPDQITLDVHLTDQGDPTISSVAMVRGLDWRLQAVFSASKRTQKYSSGILQGEYFLIGHKYTEPKAASARLMTFTGEDQSFYLDIDEGQRPQGGNGLLSGSFPLSMFTQEGNLPSQADIRILYRPEQGAGGDGYVVATTTCNADGTWQVSGLDENLKFDIVARIPGFNDVIISDVQPVTGAPLSAHFANLKEEYEYGEEINIQVVALGGRPPYTYEAITLPDGLSLSPDGHITGTMLGALESTFEVKITDAEETAFNLVGSSYVAGDPHWDKVVSLLHFDGNLNDEAGGEWAGEGYEFEDSGTPFGLMLKTDVGKYVQSQFDISLMDSEPYTLEFFLKKQSTYTTATPVSLFQSSSNRLGVYFNNQTHIRVWYNSNIITVPVDMYELHHYALVGMGNGQIRLYVDGIWDGLVISKAHDVTGKLYLGRSGHGEPYGGLIGELRITKGVARYTKNFDPPTKPFLNF